MERQVVHRPPMLTKARLRTSPVMPETGVGLADYFTGINVDFGKGAVMGGCSP
jgi:hypothetical protein